MMNDALTYYARDGLHSGYFLEDAEFFYVDDGDSCRAYYNVPDAEADLNTIFDLEV